MILPNAQDAAFASVILPNSGLGIVDADKDWIFGIDDAHKAILIFGDAIRPSLFLFLLIERDDARAKTQSDQLMAAANSQHRDSRRVNEITKVREQLRLVIIKVTQRATEDN